ncbi:uncharacterized protein LOC111110365 [Crassostrea virginica]
MGHLGYFGNLVFIFSVISGVRTLVPKNKPGKCPTPTYWNAGGDCHQDSDCTGTKKCCPHTLAGFACMEPDSTQGVASSRPGDCPLITDSKAGIVCEGDQDCMEPQICCDYGQASICVYPTVVNNLPKYKEPILKKGLNVLGNRLTTANLWLIQKLKSNTKKNKVGPQKSDKFNPRIQKLLAKLSPKKADQQKIFQKLNGFLTWFFKQRKQAAKLSPKKSKNKEKLTKTSPKPHDIITTSPPATQPGGVPIIPFSQTALPEVMSTIDMAGSVYNTPNPILIPMDTLSTTPSTVGLVSSRPMEITEAPILPPISEPDENSMIIPLPEIIIPEPEPAIFSSTTAPVFSTTMNPSVVSTDSTIVMAPQDKFSKEINQSESGMPDSELPEGMTLPDLTPIWHIIDPMSKQKIPLGKAPHVDAISPAERMYENEYGPPLAPNDASQTSFDNHFVSYLQKTMVPPESNSVYPINTLLYPEVEVFKPEKQGSCPVNLMYRRCETNCTHDDDCPGVDKCCDMGCGNVCVTPKEKKVYK